MGFIRIFFVFLAIGSCVAHTNLVLLGATGNLAKKYLWQALLAHVIEGRIDSTSFAVYAGATRGVEEGTRIVHESIAATSCVGLLAQELPLEEQDQRCDVARATLKGMSRYVTLKGPADFEALATTLEAAHASRPETLRLYYLSVSPSLYERTVRSIDSVGRPGAGTGAAMRVVFEKPFGRDLQSAEALSSLLRRSLSEREVYRVDHYLGKEGVRALAQFRRANLALLDALGLPGVASGACGVGAQTASRLLSHVEVTLTETEDVAGRSGYFDEYGVLRDVMQNHMTQAAVYAMMPFEGVEMDQRCTASVAGDGSAAEEECERDGLYGFLSDRLATMSRLTSTPTSASASPPLAGLSRPWIGQYVDYMKHVRTDLADPHVTSTTPTAAAIPLLFNATLAVADADAQSDAACRHPPAHAHSAVHFKAGKGLHQRGMAVEVRAGSTESGEADGECGVTYTVQGEQGVGPSITMSGKCWRRLKTDPGTALKLPRGWSVQSALAQVEGEGPRCACGGHFLGAITRGGGAPTCLSDPSDGDYGEDSCTIAPDTNRSNNAYIHVFRALLENDRSMFVQTEELFAQWRLWDDVIHTHRACREEVQLQDGEETEGEDCQHRLQLYHVGFDIGSTHQQA